MTDNKPMLAARGIRLSLAVFAISLTLSSFSLAAGVVPSIIQLDAEDFSGGEMVDDFEFAPIGAPVFDYVSFLDYRLDYLPVPTAGPPPRIREGTFPMDFTGPYIEWPPRGTLVIEYFEPQRRLGFDWANIRGGLNRGPIIELFDEFNASLGEQEFVSTSTVPRSSEFAGLESNIPFSRAEVRAVVPFGVLAIDNVRFEPIPEPATYLTLSLALVAVLGIHNLERH